MQKSPLPSFRLLNTLELKKQQKLEMVYEWINKMLWTHSGLNHKKGTKLWYKLQQMKSEVMLNVRNQTHRSHIIWSHLFDISKIDKSIETENSGGAAGACGGKWGRVYWGTGISFWGDENVLDLDKHSGVC